MRVYRRFKTKYEYENYLDAIKNVKHRILLTRLRISNHSLEIERGRHQRPYVTPENRVCRSCKNETEDEFHFLIRCPTYQKLREAFFMQMKKEGNFNSDQISENEIFLRLINPKHNAQEVAKYIADCLELRNRTIPR